MIKQISQNGVWAPSGAKMGPGMENMQQRHFTQPILKFFFDFGSPFSLCVDAFLEGLFVVSWPQFWFNFNSLFGTLDTQKSPKKRQRGLPKTHQHTTKKVIQSQKKTSKWVG
jgi:hypothetical protein